MIQLIFFSLHSINCFQKAYGPIINDFEMLHPSWLPSARFRLPNHHICSVMLIIQQIAGKQQISSLKCRKNRLESHRPIDTICAAKLAASWLQATVAASGSCASQVLLTPICLRGPNRYEPEVSVPAPFSDQLKPDVYSKEEILHVEIHYDSLSPNFRIA